MIRLLMKVDLDNNLPVSILEISFIVILRLMKPKKKFLNTVLEQKLQRI